MDIQEYFGSIEDFRMENKCIHKLSDILLIGLFTYLSNGEDYEDMVLFGQSHRDFVQAFCELENGIPSHDTFNRVFSLLNPDLLRCCLNDYGKDLIGLLSEKQICLDGKKLKGVSPTSKSNRGLYIVNAWVAENRLCIGQKKVEGKSNEITVLPDLIKEIDIEEAVVSIDAIGCQQEIVQQIMSQKGYYFLALKQNQSELYQDVVGSFKACLPESTKEEWEYERGRFEVRQCSILSAKDVLLEENIAQWAGLKTIVKIEATRVIGAKQSRETRYYISDEEDQPASYYNALARGHWGIENHLHWLWM
ncbi:ISAs1 family transposase [Chryseobacterium antibioticum]|uniref:ISAs1 family transposase n=1 Tax=Chryseobacterium antibioticum TaxID=2728847 RepID=UPI001E2C5EB7|nr:ISAs1 family transposase [Chryseobacterium antibioticum]